MAIGITVYLYKKIFVYKHVHELNDNPAESEELVREKNEIDTIEIKENIRKQQCGISAQAIKRPNEENESTKKRKIPRFSKNSDVDTSYSNENIREACEIAQQASSSFIDTAQTHYDETYSMVVNNINK